MKWEFLYNLPSGWHWRSIDDTNQTVKRSHGFLTLKECRADAARNGWRESDETVTVDPSTSASEAGER